MLYVEFDSLDAAFHFSVEEYLMRHFPGEEPVLMIWRTGRCVMLGAGQTAEAEVDAEAAERLHVALVRRSSGGGAIYTDPGVLQVSLLMPRDTRPGMRERAFAGLADPLVEALRRLGFPVRLEGRNDILLHGRKCSGLAQYLCRQWICTHGSLLYAVDMPVLARVLRVDEAKIASKGVRSIRGRVANLADSLETPWSVEEFQGYLKALLRDLLHPRPFVPDAGALAAVERIRREKYANPEWTYGRSPPFSFHNRRRFPAGQVEVFLDVDGGRLRACAVRGDFLALAPARELEVRLEGQPYTPEALKKALAGLDLSLFLGEIAEEQFLACLFP
jgi:lipoate-protein ligase A